MPLTCVVRNKSLQRADHSSRGVLSNVVRRCVLSENLKNGEAMARVGPQRHGGKKLHQFISPANLVTRKSLSKLNY